MWLWIIRFSVDSGGRVKLVLCDRGFSICVWIGCRLVAVG